MKTYLINLHCAFILPEEDLDGVLGCISVIHTSKLTGEVTVLPTSVEVKELKSGRITSTKEKYHS